MNVHLVHMDVLRTVRIQLEATYVIVMQDLSELSMVLTVKVNVYIDQYSVYSTIQNKIMIILV